MIISTDGALRRPMMTIPFHPSIHPIQHVLLYNAPEGTTYMTLEILRHLDELKRTKKDREMERQKTKDRMREWQKERKKK